MPLRGRERGKEERRQSIPSQQERDTARMRSLTAGHCRWIKQRGSCPSLSPGPGSNSVHRPAGGKHSSSVASLHTRLKNVQRIASLIIPTPPQGLGLYLHCRAASARSFREYYTCSLALSMTQLSEPGWAEDTPPPTLSLSPSLSFSLHPCHAAMILQRAFSPPSSRSRDYGSSRRDAGQQNPAESARACSAQPNLNQQPQQQEVISHFTIFTHLPGVYLLDRRAWQPQQRSVIYKNNHSLPVGWNANVIKKRPRQSMRHCV